MPRGTGPRYQNQTYFHPGGETSANEAAGEEGAAAAPGPGEAGPPPSSSSRPPPPGDRLSVSGRPLRPQRCREPDSLSPFAAGQRRAVPCRAVPPVGPGLLTGALLPTAALPRPSPGTPRPPPHRRASPAALPGASQPAVSAESQRTKAENPVLP